MKNIASLILLSALTLTACKTRQVGKDTHSANLKIDSSHTLDKKSSSLDSGFKKTATVTTISDRSQAEVEITTDSGTVTNLKVNPDGSMSFTGKLRRIKYKADRSKETAIHNATDEHTSHSNTTSSTEKTGLKKQSEVKDTTKTVQSSFDLGKTAALIGVIILVGAIIFIVFKRFDI